MSPPEGFTFLLGGARSGKSDIAVNLARRWNGPVSYVATAVPDDDPSFASRIERHRADRPTSWRTVEEPLDLESALREVKDDHLVVIDCVSVWVSNQMMNGLTESQASIVADELADVLVSRSSPSIVVSNEVGLGVHPSSPLGRDYRDVLGRVNRRLAERADRALFVVAGQLLPLVRPQDVFP